MTSNSTNALGSVEKKLALYDATKDQVTKRIRGYISTAIERLKEAEMELLDAVDIEFGQNPFAAFLAEYYGNNNSGSDGNCTHDEIERILSIEAPSDFGPDEEAFCSLLKEIETFKSYQRKNKRMRLCSTPPQNIKCTSVTCDTIAISWDSADFECYYEIEVRTLNAVKDIFNSPKPEWTLRGLKPDTEYHVRIRIVTLQSIQHAIWSNPIVIKTKQEGSEWVWKECPGNVDVTMKYRVGKENPRVATKDDNDGWCTIIGDAPILMNKEVSWSIKILKSKNNDGDDIYVGVTPFDINQYEDGNFNKCGWYFYCFSSTLYSGPPHICKGKAYGSRKGKGKYIHTGDSVGVVMDTTKGDLSFVLNGVDLGVAYEEIPLDKPLVSCVLLKYKGDSVELDISEVKENVDNSISVPPNITLKNGTTWDILTLMWDKVKGASFYQIEINGNKSWHMTTTNVLKRKGLPSNTEYSFRVRSVKENSVSKWSDVVRGRTMRIPIPSNIEAESGVTWDTIVLTWDNVAGASAYQVEVDGSKEYYSSRTNSLITKGFLPDTNHSFRVRSLKENSMSEWSDAVKERTRKESFETSWWKKYPGGVDEEKRKYLVDERNPRIATKINSNGDYCTIIGNKPIHSDAVTSWSIKVFKSRVDNGNGVFIGTAPFDIKQYEDGNYNKCGWYFYCYNSALYSGPPHNYKGKTFGPRKSDGQYAHTGDSVGVVVDTTKGDLSFIINNVNLGVAYKGIPLDKPLVPCVLLWYKDDSVVLDTSEVKENVDNSVPVPSNITTKSSTWDSITLIWNSVVGASFYQVEVDGNKNWYSSQINSFTIKGFLPDTNHSFRVRAVIGCSISEWSDAVEGRTQREPLETSRWKKCPDGVDEKKKYSINGRNPRVATKVNDNGYCTIIGDPPIPMNKEISWSIKILKSKNNDGKGIYVGVTPNDINQNNDNYDNGWYLYCLSSTLWSGFPHNYRWKEYGLRKGIGQYAHTGENVGVMMDTVKGELSFILDGVNHGVAYKRIPLDKPLVPCVLLYYKDDSVVLDTSEVKENVDNSVPVPSNITTKSSTWDSITLIWNSIVGASFYQVEVDGSKEYYLSRTNSLIMKGFLPGTNHSFRVRAVRGNSVGEWSGAVRGGTMK